MAEESLKKLDFVYLQLEQRISKGYWKVGERIPTEAELATTFQCSRGTVSKAIARLAHEGMVIRKTRSGTQVIRNTPENHRSSSIDLNACAFICPSDQHEGIWRIARGFQKAAHQFSRRTMVLTTGEQFSREVEIVSRLAEFNVRGAVIYSILPDPREQIFFTQMIQACPFPVVLVELNLQGAGRPAVVADGLHAGYTMTRHLLGLGLRTIGFLSNYSWVPFMRDRYLGYRQAMDEAGLGADSDLVQLDPEMHPRFEDPLREPTQIAKAYLEKRKNLEGVVCANDFLAHGALAAAAELGISVPGQLKVTGIDDFLTLAPCQPALTTYHIPYEEMGRTAYECFEALLEGRQPSAQEQQLRGHLVVRASA